MASVRCVVPCAPYMRVCACACGAHVCIYLYVRPCTRACVRAYMCVHACVRACHAPNSRDVPRVLRRSCVCLALHMLKRVINLVIPSFYVSAQDSAAELQLKAELEAMKQKLAAANASAFVLYPPCAPLTPCDMELFFVRCPRT